MTYPSLVKVVYAKNAEYYINNKCREGYRLQKAVYFTGRNGEELCRIYMYL